MKLYNTLTKNKEKVSPREKGKISMFVCGPTVYNYSHIGHARTYIFYDMLTKFLEYQGYEVFYLQNITDIDDKIIKRGQESEKDWKEIAKEFEEKYKEDMKSLKVTSVTKYARATDHIEQIKSQTKRMLKKGFAYETENGIYFDITKSDDYGKLSGRTAQQAEDATSRIDKDPNKKNKGDFCLWKKSKPDEPKWESPWCEGRPGWHIEDTAIAEKFFGFQYDIHGGALELSFPHHEAEIAQMEAISGKKPMVKYWVHSGVLNIDGKKMSKSLGNFLTIRDFLDKHSPELLRFIVFSSHYRSPLDYSSAYAKEMKNSLCSIEEFLRKITEMKKGPTSNGKEIIKDVRKDFFESLKDNFNTPEAKGVLYSFVNETNKKIDKNDLSGEEAYHIYNFFSDVNDIFGIFDMSDFQSNTRVPQEIEDLLYLREKYRKQEKYNEADKVRKKIEKRGYKVIDTDDGSKARKID